MTVMEISDDMFFMAATFASFRASTAALCYLKRELHKMASTLRLLQAHISLAHYAVDMPDRGKQGEVDMLSQVVNQSNAL